MSRSFARLAAAVASLRQPAKIEAFLNELLTPCELHDFALRWELVELLAEGVPQRQIAAKLGVSLCKITRGAKILKKRNGVLAGLVAAKPGKPAAVKKAVKVHGTRVARKS
ncbi:MAG: Trp family transcriptional regulator [Kiritimatiellia bacterium]